MKSFLYLFLFLSLTVNAQKSYVIKYKGNPKAKVFDYKSGNLKIDKEIRSLAQKITFGKYTEASKVESIFLWITRSIAYDHELRFNKNLQNDFYISEDMVVTKVIERQKALCGGFAFIFERLCNQVGIEAKTIHGYTKLNASFNKPNHTWNAVKINGQWQLLDITWSISNGKSKLPDRSWYLTKPEIFINSHYPQDRKWALLKNLPSLREFVG